MIRDGDMPGRDITVFETSPVLGGSLDGAGDAAAGYSARGGRMLTTDNYECTWGLFKSIPSLADPRRTVYDDTVAFNEQHKSHAQARLIDRRRGIVQVSSMGFSMTDRIELVKLFEASEEELGASRITDWLPPAFFETAFWAMWVTTFAFQPWHSAIELKRYLHRFILEFSRIDTLAGVKRTVFNQYESLVLPLQAWLLAHGVRIRTGCKVTDLDHETTGNELRITAIHCRDGEATERIVVNDGDMVVLQNGSMTDASSLGSMTEAPAMLDKTSSDGWTLWEKLADGRPEFGRPEAFNGCIAQSCWESFTVTLHDSAFFDAMQGFSGNEAGTGGLVTFKDSNWLMSIVLSHQPHFANQPADVRVFWGYALFPDRVGNFVGRPMEQCDGADLLRELRGHLRLDAEVFASAICIPCRMPYITSMFMPRAPGDRPPPVPAKSRNLAFVSQFVEIADDVVFTVEYSVRAAQTAVYALMRIDRKVPRVTPHDRSMRTTFDALLKAFV